MPIFVSHMLCAPTPERLDGLLQDSLQYVNVFLVVRSPKLDTVLHILSHSAKQGGITASVDLLATANTAQDIPGLHCEGTLLTQAQCVAYQDAHVLLYRAAFHSVSPPTCTVSWGYCSPDGVSPGC